MQAEWKWACSSRSAVTSTPVRQEASRAAAGAASGEGAGRTPAMPSAGQSAQASQPAGQPAPQPAAKLDEKLFTLGTNLPLLYSNDPVQPKTRC